MGTRVFYTAHFPIRVLPRMFTFVDWSELPPEDRAQRKLNEKRVPEIARYLVENEDDWVFSSLTAAYSGEAAFHPTDIDPDIGVLELPLDSRFLVNDGQHRREGLIQALKQNAGLGDQTISVVMFPDEGKERNQQMFSDLNRTVQKTSRSLDILYDHRDPINRVTMWIANSLPLLHGRVEKEAVSLSAKSAKFVTLSILYDANKQLLGKLPDGAEDDEQEMEKATETAERFWEAVTDAIPAWGEIRNGTLRPAESRMEFVHSHGVVIWALGAVGGRARKAEPDKWQSLLAKLSTVDWRRTNPDWQGVCMIGTDIVTRRQTREATTEYLAWVLGLREDKPAPVIEQVA
jgi:DNA sulfur modification protein DndB